MSGLHRLHLSPAMAVAMAALVVALGGVAIASIPGPNGVVRACYDTAGVVRVIDSTASCEAGETQIQLLGPSVLDRLRPYGAFTVARGRVETLDSAGINRVTRLRAGLFCVRPAANFEETVATVSAGFDPAGVAVAYPVMGNPDCPAHNLEVKTGQIVEGAFAIGDESFVVDPTG